MRQGEWVAGAVLFALGNVGFAGSLTFYDSLLPHVASKHEIDRVSTAGYAVGYLGGGLLLALNVAWIVSPGIPRRHSVNSSAPSAWRPGSWSPSWRVGVACTIPA